MTSNMGSEGPGCNYRNKEARETLLFEHVVRELTRCRST